MNTPIAKKKRKRGRPRKLVHYAIVKRKSVRELCAVHNTKMTIQYTYKTNHPVDRISYCELCPTT